MCGYKKQNAYIKSKYIGIIIIMRKLLLLLL